MGGPIWYECCGDWFREKPSFASHRRVAHSKICEICPKKFVDASAAIQHLWAKHSPRYITPYCENCNTSFISFEAYDNLGHACRNPGNSQLEPTYNHDFDCSPVYANDYGASTSGPPPYTAMSSSFASDPASDPPKLSGASQRTTKGFSGTSAMPESGVSRFLTERKENELLYTPTDTDSEYSMSGSIPRKHISGSAAISVPRRVGEYFPGDESGGEDFNPFRTKNAYDQESRVSERNDQDLEAQLKIADSEKAPGERKKGLRGMVSGLFGSLNR